jgi:hypothetical protein
MNIVSIPFKGAYYMCVEGSPRAYTLTAANYAFNQGETAVANDLREEADRMSGCAFESRENGNASREDVAQFEADCQTYADSCFSLRLA